MDALPTGYVFKPSKTELINDYLQNRLSNQPCHIIFDYDVYSEHPYDVLESTKQQRFYDTSGTKEGYFFVDFKKNAKEGKTRKSRRIEGQGTWSGKSKVTPVKDENGKEIGCHRYYKFEPFDECKDWFTNCRKWKMHEYSLKGNNDMIVCHITGEDDGDKKNYSATSLKRPLYEDNLEFNCEIGESSKRGCFQQDDFDDFLKRNIDFDEKEKAEVDPELLRLLFASDGNNEQAVKDLMEGSNRAFFSNF